MELTTRRERFFTLNTRLASISDEALREIFANRDSLAPVDQNRSKKHLLKLGSNKVFIKRLPLTTREFHHGYSTKNHFALPCHYNYPISSLGFGAYRYLLAHIKTTNWVLEGDCCNFPVMYHYRVVPAFDEAKFADTALSKEYESNWSFSNNIRHYIEERANADFELIIFMEYFPQTLLQWMEKNQAKTPDMMVEMRKALMFLRQNGLLHFDTSLSNILCDGKQFVLSDFTLLTDKRFELSDEERLFLGKNSHLDYVQFIYACANYLNTIYEQMDAAKKQRLNETLGIDDRKNRDDRLTMLMENLQTIQRHNLMPLQKHYVSILENCRDVIFFAHHFCGDLRTDPGKGTVFNDRKAARLLEACGFI